MEAKGHSARRSGIKARARAGWALWKISALSRHASSAVMGYVEEALAERGQRIGAETLYSRTSSTSRIHCKTKGSSRCWARWTKLWQISESNARTRRRDSSSSKANSIITS